MWRLQLFARYGRFGPHMRRRVLIAQASLARQQPLSGAAHSALYERLRRHGARPELVAQALVAGASALAVPQPIDRLDLAEAAWLVLDGGAADLPAGLDSGLVAGLAAWVATAFGSTVHLICAGPEQARSLRERAAPLWDTLGDGFVLALRPGELPPPGRQGALVLTLPAALGYAHLNGEMRGRRPLRVGAGVGALIGAHEELSSPADTWCVVADADAILLDQARQAAVLDSTMLAPAAHVEAGLRVAQRLGPEAFVRTADGGRLTGVGERQLRAQWPGAAYADAAFWACLGWFAGTVMRSGEDYEVAETIRLGDGPAVSSLGPRERVVVEAMLARRHGLELPAPEPVQRLTVQRLLRRYRRLGAAGMGLAGASAELWTSYGLALVGFGAGRAAAWSAEIAPDTSRWTGRVVAHVRAGIGRDGCVWAWVPPQARDGMTQALRDAGIGLSDATNGPGCRLLEVTDFDGTAASQSPTALVIGGTPGGRRLLRLQRMTGCRPELVLDWEAIAGWAAGSWVRMFLSGPGLARNRWAARIALYLRHRRMDSEESALRAALLAAEDRAIAGLAFAGGERETR